MSEVIAHSRGCHEELLQRSTNLCRKQEKLWTQLVKFVDSNLGKDWTSQEAMFDAFKMAEKYVQTAGIVKAIAILMKLIEEFLQTTKKFKSNDEKTIRLAANVFYCNVRISKVALLPKLSSDLTFHLKSGKKYQELCEEASDVSMSKVLVHKSLIKIFGAQSIPIVTRKSMLKVFSNCTPKSKRYPYLASELQNFLSSPFFGAGETGFTLVNALESEMSNRIAVLDAKFKKRSQILMQMLSQNVDPVALFKAGAKTLKSDRKLNALRSLHQMHTKLFTNMSSETFDEIKKGTKGFDWAVSVLYATPRLKKIPSILKVAAWMENIYGTDFRRRSEAGAPSINIAKGLWVAFGKGLKIQILDIDVHLLLQRLGHVRISIQQQQQPDQQVQTL